MARRIKPVPEIAHNLFDYEPLTGFIFSKDTGKRLGCLRPTGYITITIRNKHFFAHRVAWFLYHGENPDGLIDHINGNGSDNRIANLRVVTESGNNLNKRGVKGIHWETDRRGYTRVTASYRNRKVYSGKNVMLAHFHRRMAVVADLPVGIE